MHMLNWKTAAAWNAWRDVALDEARLRACEAILAARRPVILAQKYAARWIIMTKERTCVRAAIGRLRHGMAFRVFDQWKVRPPCGPGDVP